MLPGLLAVTVGLLAGAGGIGKAMLGLHLAVSMAAGLCRQGWLFGNDWAATKSDGPQRVVFVAAEEPVPRLATGLSESLAAD